MSIDDVLAEAVAADLSPEALRVVPLRYEAGVQFYFDKAPRPDYHRFRSGTAAEIHHIRMAEFCGEAYARKYIREVKR